MITGDELARMGDIGRCEASGVLLVWTVDRDEHVVRAYRSPTDVRVFGEGERLSGDDVLPGFDVPVAELLEE